MSLSIAGVEVNPAVAPPLDQEFLPASLFNRSYREAAAGAGGTPLKLALERTDGSVSMYSTTVLPPASGNLPATLIYVERIVKFLLWQRGGWKLYAGGPPEIGRHLQAAMPASWAASTSIRSRL